MNIKINKTNGQPDIQLNLSVRELELLTAWIGGSATADVARIINNNQFLGVSARVKIAPTDRVEVDSVLGYTAYEKLLEVLTDDSILPDPILKTVEFVYDKGDGDTKWRKIAVTVEDDYYIGGYDLNDSRKFKKFRKSNVLGGRIITV